MSTRTESGRNAKLGGHIFEHALATFLTETRDSQYEVHGGSRTKIDIQNTTGTERYSVKNASGHNTQIGLISQRNFVQAMETMDDRSLAFVEKFFGGDSYDKYPRHRMTLGQIDSTESQAFLDFLNSNKEKIYDLLFTTGYRQAGDVNYLAWARVKDSVQNVTIINLEEFKATFMKGVWSLGETTLAFKVGEKKLLHLQMKGSGAKYSAGYHSLQFHVHDHLFI